MTDRRRYAQQAFTRTGLLLLALGVAPLAIVILILSQDGPTQVPAILVGGAVGEYAFLLERSHVRRRVLAGAPARTWLTAGGPALRERLLRNYSPVPTVLLTAPYFVAGATYGFAGGAWPPIYNWEHIVAALIFSALAAASLANAAQWMYFGWLVCNMRGPK